jgi:hypothetical protein
LQEQACSIAVSDVGSMHQDSQDQTLRINEEVPLATKDFFSPRRSRVGCLGRDWF